MQTLTLEIFHDSRNYMRRREFIKHNMNGQDIRRSEFSFVTMLFFVDVKKKTVFTKDLGKNDSK